MTTGILVGILVGLPILIFSFFVRAPLIGCSKCLGGHGDGPYYCGGGRTVPNFFDDGSSMSFGSYICCNCGKEYFD